MKTIKRISLLILFVVAGINVWIIVSTKDRVYHSIKEVPFSEFGLVLGTSNRNRAGGENLFFKERMSTAAQLYKAGKVDKLIVSGDNRSRYYNEPKMMRSALMELGVPDEKIILDLEGIRTIESIKNSKDKYYLNSITIVTQEFHGYRALFISNYFHIDAQVMSTQRLPLKESGHVRLRELFARLKAVSDLYLFKTK